MSIDWTIGARLELFNKREGVSFELVTVMSVFMCFCGSLRLCVGSNPNPN